jgi:hypothetical protein
MLPHHIKIWVVVGTEDISINFVLQFSHSDDKKLNPLPGACLWLAKEYNIILPNSILLQRFLGISEFVSVMIEHLLSNTDSCLDF